MKYTVVTGAYGGMGRAVVKSLVANGYCVFALDRKLSEAEDNVIPIETDITDPESVKKAFERVRAVTDELYAIVHFAGIYMLDSLVEIGSKNFVHAFEVNLFGAFLVNKTFIPLMKKGGRIVITTSELAPLDPLPFTGIYAVTKAALDKYAYSLRMELQLHEIYVSVIRAGAVDTGMLGVSTDSLEKFCADTKLYRCNAKRFKAIVDNVEAKCVSPVKIAEMTERILNKNRPKFAYSVNRNGLLLLFNALPNRLRFWIVRQILKT